jgi:hypothetical protein
MSLYHPVAPNGRNKAIGICDRCKFKKFIYELHPDHDAEGLLVCDDCNDEKDPYKLPARKADKIALRRPRPDEPLV